MEMKNRTKDLTKGPIGKQIFLFALPLLGGSLIQQLYNTVDLIFVGQFVGKNASAAVGAGGLMVNCILGFFTGLGVGVGILAARFFAMEKKKELRKLIHCTAGLGLVFSLLFTFAGIVFTPFFLRLLNTPADIMEQAAVYLRIYMLSLFSIVSYNLGSGILRALGNTKDPMLYQMAGGILNVAGDALFICVLDMGAAGAALATVCSQTLAAVLVIRSLHGLDREYRLRLSDIHIEIPLAGQIMRFGIPAAIQSIVITLSNLIVQAGINGLGVDSIAAFTAYFKIENFIYLPIMAFGQAASTFCSQNLGAGQIKRVYKGTEITILLGAVTTILLSAVILIFCFPIFSLFVPDPQVAELGTRIARIAYPFYFLYVFLEVFSSVIRGAGKTLVSMAIILGNMCFFRILLLQCMLHFRPDVMGIAVIYPATWFTAAICMFLYYRFGAWEKEIN